MDIIPTLRYRDAHAAIAFLCDAFGFERNAVHDDDSGGVSHAQLTFGDGMVMLGSDRGEGSELNATPGGSSIYCVLDDVDGHAEKARTAGAQIVREPEDQDYGGRGYTATDPEGNRWSFGSYRPES